MKFLKLHGYLIGHFWQTSIGHVKLRTVHEATSNNNKTTGKKAIHLLINFTNSEIKERNKRTLRGKQIITRELI